MAYLGKYETRVADFKVYTSSTATATHTLSWTPTSKQSLRITINGVVQQDDAFSLTGNTVTLDAAILVTDVLEIVGVNELGGQVLVPADGSIQAGKLGSNAVTTAKIQDDAVTLAKMAGLARGKIIVGDASGDPSALALGASTYLLTSDGTDAAWAAAPAGGLTHMSQWRLTTDFDNNANPITTNLEAVVAATPTTTTASPSSSTALGDPMTVSSGIFTFPSTGYWWVHFVCTVDGETYDPLPVGGYINYTTNNSTYNVVSYENAMSYLGYYNNSNAAVFLDITDTTQCKVSFSHKARGSTDTCVGNAAANNTFMTFMRLGDT